VALGSGSGRNAPSEDFCNISAMRNE